MRLEFSQWGNFKLLDLDIPSVAYRIFAVIAIASLLAVAVYISRDQRIASMREAAEIKFISEVSRMAATAAAVHHSLAPKADVKTIEFVFHHLSYRLIDA
jgi:hypothetical protein